MDRVSSTLWSVMRMPMFLFLEPGYDGLDLFYGNGVNAGKGFVEQYEVGVYGQGARYFGAPAFATGE